MLDRPITRQAELSLAIALCAALATLSHASEFDALKVEYEDARARIERACQTQRTNALAAYGQSLGAALGSLKNSGNLDAYLAVEAEQQRFDEEQTVPTADDDTLGKLVAEPLARYARAISLIEDGRRRKMQPLLRAYVTRLDALIRQFMRQDKIEDAKLTRSEKDRASALLAELDNVSSRPGVSARPSSLKPPGQPLTQRLSALPLNAKPPHPKSVVFNGHHYLLVITRGSIDWQAARSACEKRGGHLVTIASAAENAFLEKLTSNFKAVWIGLRDPQGDGNFLWIDNSKPTFEGWGLQWNEPHMGEGRNSVAIWHGKAGRAGWVHLRSGDDRVGSYICEWDY